MRKRDWLFVISLILAAWGLDQVTKMWAVHTLDGLEFHGPFGFILHKNPGAILGAFSDLPPLLRVVSLSTGGAFLIFIYAAVQYLLPRRSMGLRAGMSLLLGGILGNVTDRILNGSVVDFLLLGSPNWASPAFNLADAIQWVGYLMIVAALIKENNQIWPSSNERKKIWVMPHFQLKYIFILMAIGLGFALISGVYSYTYLRVTIESIVAGPVEIIEERFLIPFILTFSVVSLGFLVLLFVIGRFLSHRTAGPLYAFERFLEDILAGRDRSLRLRSGDEFQHLEELSESIRSQLNHRIQSTDPPKDN